MKIAMYLQDYRNISEEAFDSAVEKVKRAGAALLVFPEDCETPFYDDFHVTNILTREDAETAEKAAREISLAAGCAVVVGGMDRMGMIFNVYANAFAKGGETSGKIYMKHTMAEKSPLLLGDYRDRIAEMFKPIELAGKKIGMTICYDCNHAAFSRVYGKNGVDILVNSTGGNVDYQKWHRYNKVRAIENGCFNFVTMGYGIRRGAANPRPNSYTYGFTPNGKSMRGTALFPEAGEWGRIGNVFMYDTDSAGGGFEADIRLTQAETPNRNGKGPLWGIKASQIRNVFGEGEKIDGGLYVKAINADIDLVAAFVENDEIVKPEAVLAKLYHPSLKRTPRKRKYLIVNTWDKLDRNYYENVLSDVLRVRAMENYCAVLLAADGFQKCYQTTDNRKSQPVAFENGEYTLDMARMGGPDAIWKDKNGMRGAWRKGYECLVDCLRRS
jgi:predicted amidohydrolase